MRKVFSGLMALAAGAFVLGAQAPVAEAAPFAKPGLSASQTAPVVDVHYKRRHHNHWNQRRWNNRYNYRRCAQLRRQAQRSGSRWAWQRYRSACVYR